RIMRENARKEPRKWDEPLQPPPIQPYVGGHPFPWEKKFASASIINEGSEGEPTAFEVTKRTLELVPA
ncbi:MAG: hypothetical protein KDB07_13220, partial [Planctomycetes bacterium]|nr:hypothetical protein [Planctomycetota bacterium]